MKSYIVLAIIILTACGTTQQSTTTCPTCPPTIRTVYDTVTLPGTPYPVYVQELSPVTLNVTVADSTPGTIWLSPSPTGDDYPQLQGAANWQVQHPGTIIMLDPSEGYFYLSHPVIWANIINGTYGQVEPDLEGPVSARNTPVSATIKYNLSYGFALGVQQAKGGKFKGINLIGSYDFPGTLNVLQIDTLTFAQWPDTAGGSSRTSPNAGICIDFASDPKYYDGVRYKMYKGLEGYYLPGMGQGGSTAFSIEDCQITNFVAGVCITPSYQANGEMIDVMRCRIDNCKCSYAYSQAQSKANLVEDLMVWGNTQTIIDGVDYGFPRGDGSTAPTMRHFNVAGYNHALFHLTAQSFSIYADDIYAENIYQIGVVEQGTAGVSFNNFQINLQDGSAGQPSPPFYYLGENTTWQGGYIRIYNNDPNTRVILNSPDNYFLSTGFGAPPILATLNPSQGPATIVHSKMQVNNGMLNSNGYDSLVYLGTLPIYVDKTTNTGYFISPAGGANDTYTYPNLSFKDYPGKGSYVSPLGYGIGRSGDTVFLKQAGQDIQDGMRVDVYDCKIKTQ